MVDTEATKLKRVNKNETDDGGSPKIIKKMIENYLVNDDEENNLSFSMNEEDEGQTVP